MKPNRLFMIQFFCISILLSLSYKISHAQTTPTWRPAKGMSEISQPPFYGIGTLVNSFSPFGWCTAFAITNRHILTNAHCLLTTIYVDPNKADVTIQLQSDIENLKFFLGLHDDTYISKHEIVHIENNDWKQPLGYEDDWAILTLKQPIQNFIPFIHLDPVSTSSDLEVLTVGYPYSSSPSISRISEKCWLNTKIISGKKYLTHTCTAERGSSGSPLITRVNGKYVLVGILYKRIHSIGVAVPINNKIRELLSK